MTPHLRRDAVARRLAVLAPPVVVLVLGTWGLGRGWWSDEAITVSMVRRSLPQMVGVLRHRDAVHGAYYLLMHVWMLPGGGERWSRLPSLAAAAGTAALLVPLGRRLASPRTGLLAGLLFAIAPATSVYAQMARSYALVGLAVATGCYCLVRALDAGGRWWPAYGAAMVAATVLHEFAALAVLAHAVTLLLTRPGRSSWRRWRAAAAGVGVVLVPIVLVTAPQVDQVDWIKAPTGRTVRRLVLHLVGPRPAVVLALLLLVLVGSRVRGQGPLRPPCLALPLMVLPAAVLLVVSLVHPVYGERYVFFSVLGLCLLAATGLDRLLALLPDVRLGALVATVTLVALLLAQLSTLRADRSPSADPVDLAGAAGVVRSRALPGDGVVFVPRGLRVIALGYPGAFTRVTDLGLAVGPVAADDLLGEDEPPAVVARSVADRRRVWVVGRPGWRVDVRSPVANAVHDALRHGFQRRHEWVRHGVVLRLFTRRAP